MKYRGSGLEEADLVVNFKNLECAFLVCTGQLGPAQGYAEHRMSIKGDLSQAMAYIRCLNILEAYLFPKIISRRIMKRVPPMGLRKQAVRLVIHLMGIPLGL